MYYEVTSRRVTIDKKGNDKSVTENFLVTNAALFSEAETAIYLKFVMENDVVAIKRSNISDVVNVEEDGDYIYLATIEETHIDDNMKETILNVIVALYADSIEDATVRAKEYMSHGLNDSTLVGVKKSKFVEVVKYLGEC